MIFIKPLLVPPKTSWIFSAASARPSATEASR